MRNIYLSLLCVLIFAVPIQADEAGEVRDLLQGKIDIVLALLQDKELDKAHRNEQITDIVVPLFDYKAMARLSLGKKHW